MKAISLALIQSIFSMFVNCFKQVKGLSKTDQPWQEWLIFVLFMALTFAVVWFGFAVSIDIMTSSSNIIPEVTK